MTDAQRKALDKLAEFPKSGIQMSAAAGVTRDRINRQTANSLVDQGLAEFDYPDGPSTKEGEQVWPIVRITDRGRAARA